MTIATAWWKISTSGFHRPIKYLVLLFSFFFLFISLLTFNVHAAQVTLTWDSDTSPGVTGYKLYYGTQSHNYSFVTNVGNSTTSVVSTLQTGATYYFAVTAYDAAGVESGYSNEVSYSVSADTTFPVITSFIIPSTATSLTVPITAFTAADNVGVSGYLLTETATTPAASAPGWSTSAPTTYTFSAGGIQTLYAWAKDAAGNVSSPESLTVTITVSTILYTDFGTGNGIWKYGSGTWSKISPSLSTNMVTSNSSLYADFGATGVWKYDYSLGTWTQISPTPSSQLVVSGSTLYTDFGATGLWKWNGTLWTRITQSTTQNMVAAGSILYGDFGANGLWKWDDTAGAWTRISPTDPVRMVTSGSTLYTDFGATGLWKWNGTLWTRITQSTTQNMVAAGSTLYGDFGANGLWKWDDTAGAWTRISPTNPVRMVTSGSTLYADFGAGSGVWKWDGTLWTHLTPDAAENMVAAGSILYGDFGANGLWKWDMGTQAFTWRQIGTGNPIRMVLGY